MNDPSLAELADMLHDPATEERALYAIGDWVVVQCRFFGASAETAHSVAAALTRGLVADLDIQGKRPSVDPILARVRQKQRARARAAGQAWVDPLEDVLKPPDAS